MGRLIHYAMTAFTLCPWPAAATTRTVALTPASAQVASPLTGWTSSSTAKWVATGRMRRAEWGMGARPLMAGPEVRIRFTTALPAGVFSAP